MKRVQIKSEVNVGIEEIIQKIHHCIPLEKVLRSRELLIKLQEETISILSS